MKQNKITQEEGNKLIAEFMEIPKCGRCKDCGAYQFSPAIIFHPKEMTYHSSYDWIMPVVKKIKEMKHPVNFYQSHIQNTVEIYSMVDRHYIVRVSDTIEKPITILWLAVVEFIEWFNKQENDKKGIKGK